jgi:protein phosphatase
VLRVAEYAFNSDTGRQRTANEDSYFASTPVFAVADGMGGAQAGEVASRIAAESFEPADRGSRPPEAYLRSIAEGANERIHELAQSDASRAGMGTTLTAAMVEGDEVSLAHVGDSRAYVFRDGKLELLTKDHSLVEELRREGRLTDEQAEDHPQRSIITRALGPEPEVEVDTLTFRSRDGDVFLLCSDGLTTMVKEPRIAEVLARSQSLDEAVSRLVREANDAGGRDNITVVAFRVAEGEPAEAEEEATLVGPTAEEAGLTTAATRERAAAPPPRRAPAPPRRRRAPVRALVAVLVLVALAAAAFLGARQVYFLGADEGGRLALFRGLPYDLPLGIELYDEVYSAPVRVASLPDDRRGSAIDHELRSRDDAVSLLEDLEDSLASPPSTGKAGAKRGSGDGSSAQRPSGRDRGGKRRQDPRPGGQGQGN